MIFTKTEIDGVWIIEPEPRMDPRGYFARLFCKKELAQIGVDFDIKQINRSFSKKRGTLRGLHYQKEPTWEAKIVQCVRGAIYNVVVDFRKDSPTFKKWIAVELSEDNKKMIYTPKGFVNGFQALTDNCELLYFMSEYYSPEHAAGLRYNDIVFNINWPIENPELSEKDSQLPFFEE